MKNVGPRKWDALPQCPRASANGTDDYLCKLAAFNFMYVQRYLYRKNKDSFQLKNKQKYAVADPGFPRGGGANPPGGANIRFCQIFLKTA